MSPFQPVVLGLNHLVSAEPWAQERLRQHAGASLQLKAGIMQVRLGIDGDGRFHLAEASTAPDVSLTVPAEALPALIFDRGKLFSSVKLEGAADIAETLAFVFRHLRWDVEADLASIIGDIAARRLTMAGRALSTSLADSVRKATEGAVEYAREEADLIAPKREIDAFMSAIDTLRDDVARLEKRIARL